MQNNKSHQSTSPFKLGLALWGGLTLLVIASLGFIYWRLGMDGFSIFIQQGVFTHLPTALASVAITWLLAGFLLYLLSARRIDASNALTWIGFFLVGLVYLNILRERFRYGDISYYIDAATQLYKNQPLPDTYFYPPLWATLIEFLIPLGEDGILLIAWLFNILSLFAFYFLLQRVLAHYGFSLRLAALVTTGFMLANAPLLRTLVYVQVNLHMLNLVFLGLLLFRRYPFFSALCMALAVHLKASPVVLVLAFLLELDWRWLAWFVVGNLLVASITVAADGLSPFLDFLRNTTVLAGPRTLSFHDSSFDALFGVPATMFAISPTLVTALTYAAKAALILVTLFVIRKNIRGRVPFSDEGRGARLFNAIPPFFILMTLASPIVWEHHGIFVALSFLLLLKHLDTPVEWILFGFAYCLQFLLPTFDFYPWSYGRLLAPLIALWLMWRVATRPGPSSTFEAANRWLEGLALK